MAKQVMVGVGRMVTPGECLVCGYDDGWSADGRDTITCDCQVEVYEPKVKIKCPVREIARALREVQSTYAQFAPRNEVSDGIDVRLQIMTNGKWAVHYGDSSFDQDHGGVWGSSVVPPHGRFDSMGMAKALWNEAVDMSVDVASDFPTLVYAREQTRSTRAMARIFPEHCAT